MSDLTNEEIERFAHVWVTRCIHSMVYHLGRDDPDQTDDLRVLVARGLHDLHEELKSLCRLAESSWELDWDSNLLLPFWTAARQLCALLILDPVAGLWPAINHSWGRRSRHPHTMSLPVWVIRNVLRHAPEFTSDGWQYSS